MGAVTYRERRIPLSLRLPQDVVEAIDRCARERGVSRTDAVLFYLRRGMDSDAAGSQGDLLESIDARLNDALQLLHSFVPPEQMGSLRGEDPIDPSRSIPTVFVETIAAACAQYPAIERAYVFGSFARGTATADSDIDIRIELADGGGFNLHDLDHFCKLIEQQTGRDVDVVSARKIKSEGLATAIDREKVLVYERETQ